MAENIKTNFSSMKMDIVSYDVMLMQQIKLYILLLDI